MTRDEFEQIGGTVDMIRRDPPETRWLATLTDGAAVIRRRAPSPRVAIEGVLEERARLRATAAERVQAERENLQSVDRPGGPA